MPKTAGRELPEELYRRLCGRFADEYANKIVLIHTVDENGWAHPAILSYFEVAARDRRNVRLATYKTSRTTQNIRRTGKLTLSIFDERVVFYIKGTAEVGSEMQSASYNVRINVAVDEVLIDQADPVLEPGAHIMSAIMFSNPNPPPTAVLKELLE